MNTPARLALAAPLALALSACGDTTPVEDRVIEPDRVETPSDVTLPTVEVEYPAVPANARDTLDYAGTYERQTGDDEIGTITLRADDTYTLRAPDGTETTGSFAWGEPADRILIERDGATLAYAVAQDVLYTLPSADAPADGGRSEETTWRRASAPPASAAAPAPTAESTPDPTAESGAE